MKTLTLTVQDEDVLEEAERNAAASSLSLSAFVERALGRANERERLLANLPPITRAFAGTLPLMTDEEIDQSRREYLERKHA